RESSFSCVLPSLISLTALRWPKTQYLLVLRARLQLGFVADAKFGFCASDSFNFMVLTELKCQLRHVKLII
ncbi:hypothetical protein, partial [Glaesserella parasuis]|uniref:hypothetical protein n=1 Tax=Glaesserella parasuis TaxID=738 RepID=UPI003F325FE0